MRITNQNRAASVSKKRNVKKTSGSGGDFQPIADEDVGETNVAAPLAPMQPITAVDSLLALQGVDQNQNQKKAIDRSREMIELLEEIRIGLLSGHIPEQKVHNLTRLADEERQAFEDKGLNNILDAVNLRAQVELAKMQQR